MAIVVTRSVTSGEVDQKAEMLNLFYPVGSYYETSNTSFDPNTAWGGTWVEDTAGRVLVAVDTGTFDTVGDTGGAETSDQINCGDTNYALHGATQGPYYDRTLVRATAIDNSHEEIDAEISLLQPYIVIKRWHRTA